MGHPLGFLKITRRQKLVFSKRVRINDTVSSVKPCNELRLSINKH